MSSVNVSRLRGRLSSYLHRVRQGEQFVVRDRNRAVALIVPLPPAEDFEEQLRDQAERGLVRLPRTKLNWKKFFALPAPRVPRSRLRAAIEAEREED